MAKATMEVSFLGTQMTQVEGTKYAKVFFGEEPDGETSQGQSIVGMAIHPEVATEVFMAGAHFELQQLVRIHFEVARGGQNKGKTIAHHIEAVDTKGRSAAAPVAAPTGAKPTEPAKP